MLAAHSMTVVGHPRGFAAGTGALNEAHEPVPASAARPRTTTSAEARLRQMVEAHYDFIWRSLRGLGVPASTAEDAAQQVFWIASRKLEIITPGSERSFLFS